MKFTRILFSTGLSVLVLSIHAQSWTPSSPNIYFSGGNVGIGTTAG